MELWKAFFTACLLFSVFIFSLSIVSHLFKQSIFLKSALVFCAYEILFIYFELPLAVGFSFFMIWTVFMLVLLNVRFSLSLEMLDKLLQLKTTLSLEDFRKLNPEINNVEARIGMANRLKLIQPSSAQEVKRYSLTPLGFKITSIMRFFRVFFGITSTG